MSYSISASFQKAHSGNLFTLHYQPKALTEEATCIVVSPALAEEMNRCRYMCNMLAQQSTSAGIGLLSVDPYGSGDSEGDFRELTWQSLCDDLLFACEYASTLGYKRIVLLGIRVGALAALNVAPKVKILNSIVLWQPVINGQATVTQMLRIKMASSLGRDENKGSTKEYEKLSADGQTIEISGYENSPGLFQPLKEAHIDQYMDDIHSPVLWMMMLASAERKAPRGDVIAAQKWTDKGKKIVQTEVVGPPFWQAHERTLCPELIDHTMASLGEWL